MKYSFKCPVCGHVVTVEAQSDDEAVEKINEEGKVHGAQVHPEMPAVPDDQMKQMVREGMYKEETAV